jgi:hypothetical protein
MAFFSRFTPPRRNLRLCLLPMVCALLAACASGPDNISLIPAGKIAAQTEQSGLATQSIKWEHRKPGCQGECPTIKLDSIAFPSVPILTRLVDHALATMTGVGVSGPAPYDTIAGYENYFWQTASPRDSAVLSAKTRYRNQHLTVIELDTWQYYTGAAHGVSATQFLNWDNTRRRVLGMADVLEPGRHPAYVSALEQAYQDWLAHNPDAQRDPDTYHRIWPFQPSDNFALTDQGMVIKYDSYQIAPYSAGQPELLIPYEALKGILRPEYLPGRG